MPKMNIAQSTAVVAPAMAHQWGRTFNPASNPSRTMMGRAAKRVESHQWPSGSYPCVQVMNTPPKGSACLLARKLFQAVKRRGLHFRADRSARTLVQGIRYLLMRRLSRNESSGSTGQPSVARLLDIGLPCQVPACKKNRRGRNSEGCSTMTTVTGSVRRTEKQHQSEVSSNDYTFPIPF